MTGPKPVQVLKIEPSSEITFHGPTTQVITAHLKLSNPSDRKVCFKVKTTVPSCYCVRPNSGIIPPQESVDVAVMLQPFKFESTDTTKHRFMVQTMFADSSSSDNIDQIWKEATPDKLMDSKLKCVFDIPNDNAEKEELKSEKHAKTPQAEEGDVKKVLVKPAYSASNKDSSPSVVDPIAKQLDDLKTENSKLKESELKLRKIALAGTPSQNPTFEQKQVQHGVAFPPIQYLLIAFIIGILIGKFIL